MKLIVVTGGVLSGLGKGVAAASIGHLLSKQYSIVPIKCDGYLNIDPGTMNPTEHGEVFVLDDGTEVDMDFGHYERFLGISCTKEMSLTMGKIYHEVLENERKGAYLGRTVQQLPHVTDHIKDSVKKIGKDTDVVLVELGGTVGDIEMNLYYEAMRQLANELGRKNALFVHLAYVPKPSWLKEHKTKPTQQSVQLLLQRGITPNIIITRSTEPIEESIKQKIQLFTGADFVVSGHDLPDVYHIPQNFHNQGLLKYINEKLELCATYDGRWVEKIQQSVSCKQGITVGIAGKYTSLEDSYASIMEALQHCEANSGVCIDIEFIETTEIENVSTIMQGIDAVIVPGGFGSRGVEGKISIIEYCRENNIPYLGICYGMQLAVIEFARNVCGIVDAHTAEVNPEGEDCVIDIMEDQVGVDKGGTMRLGAYEATLQEGIVRDVYGTDTVSERHRHRYEVNPKYHNILMKNGLVFSALHGKLAEFIELPGHPYFVGTQAHPELKSSLDSPAPLFMGLITASISKNSERLATVIKTR